MEFTCSHCGETHDDIPAIAFESPDHYADLSGEEQKSIADISNDFCVIQHEEQTDRFIRAVLFQKVKGWAEPLQYGIWVSLSEKSFNDYRDHFDSDFHEATYFGYLCNRIEGYG